MVGKHDRAEYSHHDFQEAERENEELLVLPVA